MKFNKAWDSLPLEAKQAIAKRVFLNYMAIASIFLMLIIIFVTIFSQY